jgi:hypothetical protein
MSLLITMSQKELHRLEVIQKIRDNRLGVVQGAELLDLSRSQVHRLLQAYDLAGPAGLVSKKRSRPSNRRHSEEFRNAALDLLRERYLDFGPTISVSKETLRQWMTDAGIWISRRERKKRVFQPRGRRDCFGELVQIDGSHHWWFENTAAQITGVEPGGKHLAVHARELALKPRLQVIRGYRRSLLLRLENPAGPTVEDHVDRKTQMGARVLINDGWYK